MRRWADHGFLPVGEQQLEYGCWGPAPDAAPTLVLLHEGLGCLALWRDFPERLVQETGWGVLAYSRAGYGQSDPAALPRPLDYMTKEALEVLPHVLSDTGVQRCVLLGHSDGATIAAIYAGSRQDRRVRGLVLMAPHFFTEDVGLKQIAAAREAFEHGDLKDRLGRYHRDPEATFRGWNDAWFDPEFAAWDVSDVIDYLRVPTLAIQGRADQYGTLSQIEALEARAYAPVETLILDDCRHAPHQDQPEAVLSAVADFSHRLSRIEAAGAA